MLYHQLMWGATEEELLAEIRQSFAGEVAFADDLDVYSPRKQRKRLRSMCGGGAIFNIVGSTIIPVGKAMRANNVEGGSSREPRPQRRVLTGVRKR